jgi:hypothetical protein
MAKITVKGTEIVFYKREQEDYISLTDIAKVRDRENPSQIISLWLRTYNTIEYLGLWEMLNNPNFNPHIYEGFKNESAKPHFWMSPTKSCGTSPLKINTSCNFEDVGRTDKQKKYR